MKAKAPIFATSSFRTCKALVAAAWFAVELFSRITSIFADETVSTICKFCGYLPLAVRAAASRLAFTPDLSPSQYLLELKAEKKRLSSINNPEIGVAIEASINMSYLPLEADTAQVFRWLAVFPGTWNREAEEAVCVDTDHRHLSTLVKAALVLYDQNSGRYRLHDLVRLSSNSRLPKEEREYISGRFSAYFAEMATKGANAARGDKRASEEFLKCKAEWGNLEAAQEWAASNFRSNIMAAC